MRRSATNLIVLLLTSFLAGVSAQDKPAAKRLPPPSNEEVEAFRVKLSNELTSMGGRVEKLSQRAMLARHLLARSKPSEATPVIRFVHWREAQRFAIDAGDVRLSHTALDRLLRQFELNRRSEQNQMLVRLTETSTDASSDADLIRVAAEVLRESLTDGDTDFGAAYETLSTVARRRLDLPLLRQATSLAEEWTELNELQSAHQAMKKSDTLSPAEHHAFGQFLIRRRHDWAAGLKELQKSEDGTLAKLAQRDLANPRTPAEQFQLAEDWYRWATADDRPPQLWQIAACHHWLAQSEPKLTGENRKQAQRRLREFGQPLVPRVAPPRLEPLAIAAPAEQELLAAFTTKQTPRLMVGPAKASPLAPSKPSGTAVAANSSTPKNAKPAPSSPPQSPMPSRPGAPAISAENAAASRKAAEWMLAQGPFNSCVIRLADGQIKQLREKSPLPDQPFSVTYVGVNFIHPQPRDTDLSHLVGLSDLETLNLDVRDLKAADLKHLDASQKLRMLSFSSPSSSDPLFESLSLWPELRFLNLRQTQVTKEGLARIAPLQRLEALVLHQTRGMNDACLATVAKSSSLRQLDFDGTEVTDAGIAELIPMPNLANLNVMPAPNITDAAAAHFVKMPALIRLFLFKSQLTDAGLAQLKPMTRLQRLFLDGSKINGTGLAELANCQELRELDFTNSSLTEAGFAAITQLPALQQLNLAGTPISAAAAKQLSQLQKLQYLTADNSRLTDEAIAELANHPALTMLNAGNNELTDKSIDSLATLKMLRSVSLYQTKVTRAGAERLKKALPECQVQGQFDQ